MAVTMQQIADLAGVSRGTVDRALNNRGRIRPEVAEKIKMIAKELGYQPNIAAKAGRSRGCADISSLWHFHRACMPRLY